MSPCPCCGHLLPTRVTPLADLAEACRTLCSPSYIVALRRLIIEPGQFVSTWKIADAVYGGRPDGGPSTAYNCLYTQFYRYKKQLASLGWRVRGSHHHGYVLEALA